MGKETNIEIEYSATTFVPSYERKQQKEGTDTIFVSVFWAEKLNFWKCIRVKVPFTPPSYGEKFISTFITATVWAGVLVTLPLTFFWVFKKEKENEKILVRRLGKSSQLFSGPKTDAGNVGRARFWVAAKTELFERKASRYPVSNRWPNPRFTIDWWWDYHRLIR